MDQCQLCEICHEALTDVQLDLNTDEQSEPVLRYVCAECAYELY
jgi:protein-arginine kinase activator protein McsA